MTVKIMQRIPDRHTHERHDYIKHDVKTVNVYKAGLGMMYIHMTFRDGRTQHMPLGAFDFEIIEDESNQGRKTQ